MRFRWFIVLCEVVAIQHAQSVTHHGVSSSGPQYWYVKMPYLHKRHTECTGDCSLSRQEA